MRYPLWFPYPSAWLKALILVVAIIPLLTIIRIIGESAFNFLEVAWRTNLWLFLFWITFTLVLTPIFFLGHLHQMLWGESHPRLPKCIPSLGSWAEGLLSWLAIVLGMLNSTFIVFWLHDFNPPRSLPHETTSIASGFLFVTIAYVYHLKALIQIRLSRKPSIKSSVQPNK